MQLLLDCSELESRLTEALGLVKTEDYGKDQLATLSFLTKHQVQHSPVQLVPQKHHFSLFLIFSRTSIKGPGCKIWLDL